MWAYLSWALGLRSLGCKVIWMEAAFPNAPLEEVQPQVAALKRRLERYDLAGSVALCSWTDEPLPRQMAEGSLDLEAATEADLVLNMAYEVPPGVIGAFRRSAMVDIDPGLTQIWMSEKLLKTAPHDVYFTIGETVGRPGAPFPDCGIQWQYTPPPVFLPAWPQMPAGSGAPYTTVTHWWGSLMEFNGESYYNGKRDGFLPFLELPSRTKQALELTICLEEKEDKERAMLEEQGWRLRDPRAATATPWDYQRYIQNSRGEFSCVKPSCVHLQNAWVSDRTLCYLASGKPAVVQHTGPSRFLPDSAGLFRFRDLQEAAHCLEAVEADYGRQSRLARALAEEHFDAEKVVGRVLERTLDGNK